MHSPRTPRPPGPPRPIRHGRPVPPRAPPRAPPAAHRGQMPGCGRARRHRGSESGQEDFKRISGPMGKCLHGCSCLLAQRISIVAQRACILASVSSNVTYLFVVCTRKAELQQFNAICKLQFVRVGKRPVTCGSEQRAVRACLERTSSGRQPCALAAQQLLLAS